ncbi:MAG: hypothetical protein GY855_02205 [candidate division Zixibacteria bacterium]|nr:hypothetical protein [candidate division Zixibacteria bacterium]
MERRPDKILNFFVGIAVTIFFLTFGFWFFEYIFEYLKQLGDVGELLVGKVISLAFFAVMILLFVSNLLTGISTIFTSKESAYLYTLPISYRNIFLLKAFDSYIYSTWAFAILGIPMIAAYGGISGFALWQYLPIVIFVFVPFTLIPAALSTFILLIYYRFANLINAKKAVMVFAVFIAAIFYIYLKSKSPENLSLYTYQDWRILNDYLSGMALSSSMLFPSKWVSGCLLGIETGDYFAVFTFILALISTVLFFGQVVVTLCGHLFADAWQNGYCSGNTAVKRPFATQALLSPIKSRFIFLPLKLKALLYKDSVIFLRDSAQWGQFSILIGLIIVYLFNLRFFPANLADPFWKSVVAFANFAFTGFVLATLAVRFVFPTISMEGKSFWVLKSSPVPSSTLFWGKFTLSFIPFVLLAEILAFISSRMLALTPLMTTINYFGIFLISISLTGLAIGMGAIFPNFEEQNPSRIASRAGGMLTAILSLIYVCIIVVLTAYPTHLYTQYLVTGVELDNSLIIFSFAAIAGISLIAFTLPVIIGLRNLKRLEF